MLDAYMGDIPDAALYRWLGESEQGEENEDDYDYDPEWDNWVKPSEREVW